MPGISVDAGARAPTLRLLPGEDRLQDGLLDERVERAAADGPPLRLVESRPPLLVAGADPARRAMLLRDLIDTMPEGTMFEQASALGEVLEHAPMSRMVILSGPLDDASPRAVLRVLGQRHPGLPVITVDAACRDEL